MQRIQSDTVGKSKPPLLDCLIPLTEARRDTIVFRDELWRIGSKT